MLELELNLERIASLAARNQNDNMRFRSFLKSLDDKKVDAVAHRIYRQLIEQIDCKKCGNCCKKLTTNVTDVDIGHLAKTEKITPAEFEAKYVEYDPNEHTKSLKGLPCRYFEGNKCSIYDYRPAECKDYPNVHKKFFSTRGFFMVGQYAICPIVFNVIENLKSELKFY
jgi:Fe-S-cluster containining protein